MRATPRGRQYTLILVGDRSSSVRKVQLPQRGLKIAAALLAAVGVTATGILAHYASMLATRGDARAVREENAQLRSQLHAVEDRIAHITATLDRVEQFDAKLRGTVKKLQGTPRGLAIGPVGKADEGGKTGTARPGGSSDRDAAATPRAPGASPATSSTAPEAGAAPSRDVAARLASLDRAAAGQESSLKGLHDYFESQQALLSSTPTAWPARGWVTSDFGERLDPYTADRMMHRGLDIATPPGHPVVAPSDGTVTFAGNESGYGKVVVLDHGYGINTRYGHLSAIYVKPGQRVKRGARVAAVGNTGRSTGPHLHYEVRVNGVAENPRKFLME